MTGVPAPTHASLRHRALRAIAVLAFVALVGPAIGGVLFPGPFYAPQIWWGMATGGLGSWTGVLTLLGYMALFGYVAGLVPALVAGVVMGFATFRRGTFGYRLAMAAGLAGAAGMALAILFESWRRGPADTGTALGVMVIYIPLCLAAAIACRFLMARIGLVPGSRKRRRGDE